MSSHRKSKDFHENLSAKNVKKRPQVHLKNGEYGNWRPTETSSTGRSFNKTTKILLIKEQKPLLLNKKPFHGRPEFLL